MTDDDNGIPRRKVLAALSTIGTAGVLGGASTYAVFSDRESLAASFMAGKIDLTVHYTSAYDYGKETVESSGEVDGSEPVTLFNRPDLKPGDSGRTEFCFELATNPAYLWLCGEITADREDDDSQKDGELDENIQATLRYCQPDGSDGAVIVDGTLGDVMDALSGGVPLDSNSSKGVLEGGQQAPYQPSSEAGAITGPCVCIKWEIPMNEVGNEIQSDELDIAFRFNAIQARHNDGTGSPCGDGGGGGDGGGDGNDGGGGDNGGPKHHAISFAAFCYSGDTEPTIGITITDTKDGSEPLGISWTANPAVDGVVLKAAGNFEKFPGGNSGTAHIGQGSPAPNASSPNPCPNHEEVKFEYNKNTDSFERE